MMAGGGELNFWPMAVARLNALEESVQWSSAMTQVQQEYRLMHATRAGAKPWLIDKRPANFLHLGWVRAVFPTAKIIHLNRDRHDTCLSIYMQNFNALGGYADDWGDLQHYYERYQEIVDYWRSTLTGILEVPYEGLVQDPARWLGTVCDWLSVPFEAHCLNVMANERAVQTASRWQTRQPVHQGSIGRYQRYRSMLEKRLKDQKIR